MEDESPTWQMKPSKLGANWNLAQWSQHIAYAAEANTMKTKALKRNLRGTRTKQVEQDGAD